MKAHVANPLDLALVSKRRDAERSRDLRLCASGQSAGGWRRRAGDREKVPS
jgi:hypothetical protein